MKVFNEIPDNVWDEGAECIIWLGDDGYVYKAYKKIQFLTELLNKLNALNSLPEYETEEIYGIYPSKKLYITRQKRLKDWELIFVEYYISQHRRLKDWEPILNDYMISKGYEKYRRGWKKNNIIINDIDVANIGMTENDEIKIIDANLMSSCMLYSEDNP